jgi:nucleoid-associated protein YgaU
MQAKLINEKLPFEIVEFDFNPDSIVYSRQTQTRNNGGAAQGAAGSTPSILLKAPPKEMQGSGYLIGDDVHDRADQLYSWMDPGGGLIGQLVGAAVGALTGGRINLAARPPALIFQWGTQIMRCIMVGVNVTFERFSSSGDPDRALVKFTVREEANIFGMLPTNPTSGGLPGRQRHVVTGSESLPGISTAAYGSPGLWRAIADTNNVDDPFRVRPGHTVYLPNPDEIRSSR